MRSRRHASTLAASALLMGACGQDPDVFVATFDDELVEAPVRSVEITVVPGAECPALLSVRHDEVSQVGSILTRRIAPYPVAPNSEVLRNLPRGEPLALDVAAYDYDGLQVARACEIATLDPELTTTVEVPMRALPACTLTAGALDLVLILDASVAMRDANTALGGELIDRLQAFVASGFPPGSRVSLFLHGASPPVEVVPPTGDLATLSEALWDARDAFGGEARHYEAISLAAGQQRARATCARRPALLVVAAGPDSGAAGAFENAQIAIVATRGDTTDDIHTLGIAVSTDGRAALDDLIHPDFGQVRGALTGSGLGEALRTSRSQLLGLVGL